MPIFGSGSLELLFAALPILQSFSQNEKHGKNWKRQLMSLLWDPNVKSEIFKIFCSMMNACAKTDTLREDMTPALARHLVELGQEANTKSVRSLLVSPADNYNNFIIIISLSALKQTPTKFGCLFCILDVASWETPP